MSEKKKKKESPPLTDRKLKQVELRRKKIFILWLYGYRQVEMAAVVRANVRTVARDLDVIKKWADEREVTWKKLSSLLLNKIEDITGGMRLDLMKVEGPEKRIRAGRILVDPLIEMWKKLMPTEIKFEGFMQPPLGTDVVLSQQEELSKRAPKNKSGETIRKRIKDRASQ